MNVEKRIKKIEKELAEIKNLQDQKFLTYGKMVSILMKSICCDPFTIETWLEREHVFIRVANSRNLSFCKDVDYSMLFMWVDGGLCFDLGYKNRNLSKFIEVNRNVLDME